MSVTDGIKKNLGFGCMRFPMTGENYKDIDIEQVKQMTDEFLAAGFNYFDTAHCYLNEKSELAVKEMLTSRYPRESYILTTKLTDCYFNKEEDIRPFFEKQLDECGVDYFDFYLMHALKSDYYHKYRDCRAFEIAAELKAEGKIRHVGMSFHDSPEVLDMILNEQPAVEVVQLQFNYLDYDDPWVRSYECYKVCRKHNKPVIVMEPVKGGSLVDLPPRAGELIDGLGEYSRAGYAIRFAASFEGVFMVLSGMSNIQQMRDNINTMKDFRPFNDKEYETVARVRDILRKRDIIPCTACRYCTDAGCPAGIPIPEVFSAVNKKRQDGGTAPDLSQKASGCLKCGKCEGVCPQQLKIRELLHSAVEELA